MDLTELNSLPDKVKLGELTIEQAAHRIWEIIYKNPVYFGLGYLDEDQRSDFLLSFSPSFRNIVSKYKEGPVDFYYYLCSSLRRAVAYWLKRYLKKYASDACAAEVSEQCLLLEEGVPPENMSKTDWENSLTTEHMSKKKKLLIKNLIHVLACKACNELDDEMISRIASFLEISELKLRSQIFRLQQLSGKKLECRQKIIERRNKAYFFHKKYRYELSKIESDTDAFVIMKEKYEHQTKNWEKNNRLLTKRYLPVPTTEEIAENTGLKPRTVWFYLNHAKRRKEFFPFIEK